ncbi:MAG: glycosyltransferase family 4 protein [Candidatus Altiarchaeota archaeon]
MSSRMENTGRRFLWLRERFAGWIGSHSGYEPLFREIQACYAGDYVSFWRDEGHRLPRHVFYPHYLLSMTAHPRSSYNVYGSHAETTALWHCLRNKPDLMHYASVERQLRLLPYVKKRLKTKVVGTSHQNIGYWEDHRIPLDILSSLDELIVVSNRQKREYEPILPGRVHFIPHGVDTGFFHPTEKNEECLRCVYAGVWQRDSPTMVGVVEKLLAERPKTHLDLVVPREFHTPFSALMNKEGVTIHSNITDEELRDVYRKASLLILPLTDCTANNTILEAMACGLPIVSNDVGGIRDYVTSDFSSLHPVGDVEGMVESALNLLEKPGLLSRMSESSRKHAVENFGWERIAEKVVGLYDKTLV